MVWLSFLSRSVNHLFGDPSRSRNPSELPLTELELTKRPGIKSYTVSLEDQTATVIAEPTLEYETVLSTIKKTGKKVNSAEVDGAEKSVE